MAARARAVPRERPEHPEQRSPVTDVTADQVLTVALRVLARFAVRESPGARSASFRQIATSELRIASDADVDVLEAWLRDHPA